MAGKWYWCVTHICGIWIVFFFLFLTDVDWFASRMRMIPLYHGWANRLHVAWSNHHDRALLDQLYLVAHDILSAGDPIPLPRSAAMCHVCPNTTVFELEAMVIKKKNYYLLLLRSSLRIYNEKSRNIRLTLIYECKCVACSRLPWQYRYYRVALVGLVMWSPDSVVCHAIRAVVAVYSILMIVALLVPPMNGARFPHLGIVQIVVWMWPMKIGIYLALRDKRHVAGAAAAAFGDDDAVAGCVDVPSIHHAYSAIHSLRLLRSPRYAANHMSAIHGCTSIRPCSFRAMHRQIRTHNTVSNRSDVDSIQTLPGTQRYRTMLTLSNCNSPRKTWR